MILKLLSKLGSMSKKTSLIFLSILTLSAIVSISLLVTGLIFYTRTDSKIIPSFSLPLIIVGATTAFIELLIIALTTISSNFLDKINSKIENKEKKEEK